MLLEYGFVTGTASVHEILLSDFFYRRFFFWIRCVSLSPYGIAHDKNKLGFLKWKHNSLKYDCGFISFTLLTFVLNSQAFETNSEREPDSLCTANAYIKAARMTWIGF
jgi:hypothetical protein